MRTIKQVSDLTGVSVRMLHYYDQIGLLCPTETTAAGYRLYDDAALETLQQILFFKELQVPLKEMKQILDSPHYDKMQTLQRQKKLLCLRRHRLDELIALIDKKMKGGHTMSFKEFDLSEYFAMQAERAVDRARAQVAATLGVTAAEITFTACGSESDNIALQGAAERTEKWAKNIVATGYEHPAVARTLELLGRRGWEIRFVHPKPDGKMDEAEFLSAIDRETGVVTFMFVNNEIGTLLDPVTLSKKIRAINHRASIHAHYALVTCRYAGGARPADLDFGGGAVSRAGGLLYFICTG